MLWCYIQRRFKLHKRCKAFIESLEGILSKDATMLDAQCHGDDADNLRYMSWRVG